MFIQNKRKEQRLSQEQVANALGVSQQAVASWESGRTRPRSDTLVRLADILGVTVDELLRKEG